MNLQETFFVESLLDWYEQNGRSFPWRDKEASAYQILIAELMLKKTKADNVVPIYLKFLSLYQSPKDVYEAPVESLENILAPLGLVNQRVKAIKSIFTIIETQHNGFIPDSKNELLKLPYVGLYTANAVLCFAYGQDLPVVDVNVLRICERFFGIKVYGDNREDMHVWEFLEDIIPKGKAREFNYALLDFGNLVCKSRNPDHSKCIFLEICEYCKVNIC